MSLPNATAATLVRRSPACRVGALVLVTLLSACGTTEAPRQAVPLASVAREPLAAQTSRSPTLQQLTDEAAALAPLANSELGKRFLRATDALPTVGARIAHRDDNTREFFSPAEAAAMPEDRRKKLTAIKLDEYRYYYTKYGSPLAYLRALDLASRHGVTDVKGVRILDFGYGSIGHLRLLASLGAHVVGIDPDSYLDALYSQSNDQGAVAPARNVYRGHPGSVSLAHGRWPTNPAIATQVAATGPYQLIISKNTLKRGYLKPERRAAKNQLIDLGVSDDVFLKTVHASLAPGGLLLIYNLAPKQAPADKPYLPHADARSPFSVKQFARANLEVIAFNTEDHEFIRNMGLALRWDRNEKGEIVNDLDSNLFALYTVVRRGN